MTGPQIRIAAFAIGVVAIWWILWGTIDADGPSAVGEVASELASGAEPAESPAPHSSLAQEAPDSGPPEPASSVPEPVESPPAPLIRLFGSILDERDREPISGASLRLVDAGWDVRTAGAKGSGEYEFADLHPGTWEMTVEADQYRTLRRLVELTSENPEERIDLVLTAGEIVKVKIVSVRYLDLNRFPWRIKTWPREDAGRLAPTATLDEPADRLPAVKGFRRRDVGIFYARESGSRATVETRLHDGSVVQDIPPEYCGVLVLSEPAPVFASLVLRDAVLQTRTVLPGADEVTFELRSADVQKLPGTVRLQVLDADRDSPLLGEDVLLRQRSANQEGMTGGTDGTFVFEEVFPGSAILTISAEGREVVMESVFVQPGKVTDLGVYRLQRFSVIRGKVVDDEGEPAQVGFNVFPFDRYESTRETLQNRIFRSSQDGELKIDSVGRGRYLIVANDNGWASMPVVVDTTVKNVEGLEIRVSKGTPVGIRLRADPLPAARLEIRTRSGLPVEERRCWNRDPMHFVLARGTYSVELWNGETWLASETLVVGAEPVRIYFPR